MGNGVERGGLAHSSSSNNESSPSGPEQEEEDGALGGSGGQPDASPSGPINDNNNSESKVKTLFELGTRHKLRAFASYFQFHVKGDF